MYLKLAFRNAKRSVIDYLLYITTMTILIAVMYLSNCIAILGNIQVGFQTASLPILIVLIMVTLIDNINAFMIKQRAKEFANYLLLGMEKGKLSHLFLIELYIIGILCFIFAILIGTGIYLIILSSVFQGVELKLIYILQSIIYTLFYVVLVEILSTLRMKRRIFKLQISELMSEKLRNQPLNVHRKNLWLTGFIVSFISLILLLCGVVFMSDNIAYIITSVISIPLLCSIFAFYQWLYTYFSSRRLRQTENLYQGNRLYRIVEITTRTKTSALMSSIFCVSLYFAAVSFVFGTFLLNRENLIFAAVDQQWMGFLQISICIIFIIIYFSILSLQQIIELKRQAKDILILHYMGKSKAQLKSLLKKQIMLKLSLPTLMCFILLLIGIPCINYKINIVLPTIQHNSLIKAIGEFTTCFLLLYLCYFGIIYTISTCYINKYLFQNSKA